MALRIQSINKWAVTGTPIGKHGFEDLYGLMVFLGLSPWNERTWWKNACHRTGFFHPLFFRVSIFLLLTSNL